MRHYIAAKTVIKAEDIKKYNPVIIHWVGGSYGNFVYRMLHRYISGFPIIDDDFKFINGNSHHIYDVQYIDDFNTKEYKKDLITSKEITFDLLAIKKHGYSRLNYKKFWLSQQAYYNIKIKIPNKSCYIFSVLQNFLKISNKSDFIDKDGFSLDDIINNNFENQSRLEDVVQKIVNGLDKSWYVDVHDDKNYTIDFTDILDADKFYNHFLNISKNLNQQMLGSTHDFYNDHAIFLKNQQFLDSYYRFINQETDTSVLLDVLMKKFS